VGFGSPADIAILMSTSVIVTPFKKAQMINRSQALSITNSLHVSGEFLLQRGDVAKGCFKFHPAFFGRIPVQSRFRRQ
jgi:hypothetical protein